MRPARSSAASVERGSSAVRRPAARSTRRPTSSASSAAARWGRAGDARFASPDTYTPSHLARKILTARTSLAGERKTVTVLFADLKGSLELLADRDPEDARALLDARASSG